jgi:hypothetical protein
VKPAPAHFEPFGWALIALLPMALVIPVVRHTIESRMLLHMMFEFPCLMASGWASGRMLKRAAPAAARALAFVDWQGWVGASLALFVTMAWMIPSALDAALLSTPVAAVKMVSWWLAGLMLAGSWNRLSPEVLLFAAGNAAWMMATAGALYIDAPLRLCASYLLEEQRYTGIALLAAALAIGTVASVRATRLSRLLALRTGSSGSSATQTNPRRPSAHAPRPPAGGSDRPRACAAPRPGS